MKTNLFLLFSFLLLTSCSSFQKKEDPNAIPPEEKCEHPKMTNEIFHLFFEDDFSKIEAYINKNNVSMDSRGVFCKTFTHEAIRDPKLLNFFLNKGSPLDEINEFKETPLSEAVDSNNLEAAEILLKKGARVNLVHSFDNSLIFKAVKLGHEDMLDLLIQYQACPLGVGFMNVTLEEASKTDSIKSKVLDYKEWFIKNKKTCADPEIKPSKK